MRRFSWVAGLSSACALVSVALGQPASTAQTSPQIIKEWTLGKHTTQELENRDGRINDSAMSEYLQRIENRLAGVAWKTPYEIRLTRSPQSYSTVLTNGVQYLSAGLGARVENEMELAGLLAHQLAHQQIVGTSTAHVASIPVDVPPCVLSRFGIPGGNGSMRDQEQQANFRALGYLKAAGYDPAGLLDLFSKLAYEHPAWAQAIVSEDLLNLRIAVENEAPPPGGYRVNTNEFSEQHGKLLGFLGQATVTHPSLSSSDPILPRR